MTEKLPTRSELMDEMLGTADYVNNGENTYGNRITVLEYGDGGSLFFWCGENQVGKPREYLPEPVAPAKWEPVFIRTGGDLKTVVRISAGSFGGNGMLQCVCDSENGFMLWDKWCSINNRDHHSEGWKREWETIQ